MAYGKKIRVLDDDANHDNQQEQEACYDFWNEAPEDVLTEIFIRLPDCRSAARSTAVCRHWRSLTSGNPHFMERFKSHHRRHHHRYPPESPWTIFMLPGAHTASIRGAQRFRTLCQLHSDEWTFLHGKTSNNCFDFLPSPVVIKASCNDLLLVSSCLDENDLHVCNPLTKDFAGLPPIPKLENLGFYESETIGYALVCIDKTRFKAIRIVPTYTRPFSLDLNLEPNCIEVPVSIFCSESRKWETKDFPCLGPSSMFANAITSEAITCNGVVYWMGFSGKAETVFYLDLSNEKCGAISIPFGGDQQSKNRIGVVHEELRLIQVLPVDQIRVWRLNVNDCYYHDEDEDEEGSNWFLVHDKKLTRPEGLSEVGPFMGSFVHPTNGDSLFVVWGNVVFDLDLINAVYKKIVEFRDIAYWFDVAPFLMVLSSSSSSLANSYL